MTWVSKSIAVAFAMGTAFQPAVAVPPPVERFSADCVAPTYASDQLVCGEPELLALDRQMRDALPLAGLAAVEPSSPLIEGQAEWFRRRNLCAMQGGHSECLRQAYRERLAVLAGLTAEPSTSGTAYRCAKGAPFQVSELTVTAESATALDGSSRVVSVASARREGNWRPFVSFAANGRKATLTPLNGRAIKCARIGNRQLTPDVAP